MSLPANSSFEEAHSMNQVLWSIEAGVAETSKAQTGFPIEVSQELDRRVRQVSEEFAVLSQMVNKCKS